MNKEIKEYMQRRRNMLKDGFPYCHDEEGFQQHCDTCIRAWECVQKNKCKHNERPIQNNS